MFTVLDSRFLLVEGVEYVVTGPVYREGVEFSCEDHAPEGVRPLTDEALIEVIREVRDADRVLLARQGNFTQHPNHLPHCHHCHTHLTYHNRPTRTN